MVIHMKKTLRFLSLVMALALVLGAVPALAELSSTYKEFAEPHSLNVTWFEQGWTGPIAGQDIIAPEIAKRTNLTLNYEAMTVPTADDYTQRLNLMVAASEVPQVFFGGNDAYTRLIYQKLGESGALWDFSEIIKDYKNLYELVYPELNLFHTADGKNYFVPTQTGRGYENLNEPPHGMYIRQDFLDQLGMEEPKTPEEFYTYLKRCREEIKVNDQKVNGLLLGENIGGINHLYEMFFPLLGEHEVYGLPFDTQDGYKVKNYEYTNSPELMKGAKFVWKLMSEKLIDREVLTIKTTQYQEKASSGLPAAMTAAWWDMNTFSDNAKADVPNIFWVWPKPIYETEEIKASRNRPWTDWVGCWSSLIVSSTVDEATVRHLLALMDYLVGQEGQLLVQVGIENETFAWNEQGHYVYTPEFIKKTNDLDWNKAAAYGVFYYSQLVNNTPAITGLQDTPPALTRPDNRKNWENYQIRRDAYDKHMEPTLDYYFLPGEVENEKFQAIKDAKTEFWAKVLSAGSEEEVEQLVNEWGEITANMGINEIIAERQAFIDKLVAEKAAQ